MTKTEEWKPVVGYEGLYEVSNKGNVRHYKQGMKKVSYDSSGYGRLLLYRNNKWTTKYIHRLVAKAFIPNPSNKRCVHHKDADKTNNSAENLGWVTHAQNEKLEWSSGRKWTSQFTREEVDEFGRRYEEGESAEDIAKTANASGANIRSLIKRWTDVSLRNTQFGSKHQNVRAWKGMTVGMKDVPRHPTTVRMRPDKDE